MEPTTEFQQRPVEWWATLFSFLGLLDDPAPLVAFEIIASEPERQLTIVKGKAKLYGSDGINEAKWREWIDKRVVNDLILKEFDAEVKPYETTEATSVDGPMWGPVLVEPLKRAPEMLKSWLRWRNRLCMAALIDPNAVAVDGNSMFDIEHQHLDPERGTYSNILAGPARTDTRAPTPAELGNELSKAQEKLFDNAVDQDDLVVVEAEGVDRTNASRYAVITTDNTTRAAFRKLLRDRDLVDSAGTRTSNEHKGTFSLLQYGQGAAGSPYYVVRASTDGPRPTMWAPVTQPRVLEERNRDRFDDALADIRRVFGMRALGGARGTFAETVVRVDPG